MPIVRSLFITFLLLGLCGPSVKWKSQNVCQFYLLDMSGSCGDQSQELLSRIRPKVKMMESGDLIALIRFGAKAKLELLPVSPREFLSFELSSKAPPNEGTDLSAALMLAQSHFKEGYANQIIVLSDGNFSRDGELAELLKRFDREQLIFHPLETSSDPVIIQSFKAPAWISPGQNIQSQLLVKSATGGKCLLEFFIDGTRTENPLEVEMSAGEVLPLSHDLFVPEESTQAMHRFRVLATPLNAEGRRGEDPYPQNNEALALCRVAKDKKFLLISGRREGEGFGVLLASNSTFNYDRLSRPPADSQLLAGYSAVILEDLPHLEFERVPGSEKALIEYIRAGGGLLNLGIFGSYGYGAYENTELGKILPLKTPEEKRKVAVIVVMDCSGSMRLQTGDQIKLDVARNALTGDLFRELDWKDDGDRFGLITLGGKTPALPGLAVDIRMKAKREDCLAVLRSLDAFGETQILPALREALNQVKEVEADQKLVMLFSDGESQETESEFTGMGKMFADAQIPLTVIQTGGDGTGRLRNALALSAQGRFIHADFQNLSSIFGEQARQLKQDLFRSREDGFYEALLTDAADAAKGLPEKLSRYIYCQLREPGDKGGPKPLEKIRVDGNPLCAEWKVGLGRVRALALDAESLALAESLNTTFKAGVFLAEQTASTAQSREDGGFHMEIQLLDDTAFVFMETQKEVEEGESWLVSIQLEDNENRECVFRRTGANTYEAVLPKIPVGAYLGTLLKRGKSGDEFLRGFSFVIPYSAEWSELGGNEAFMDSLEKNGLALKADHLNALPEIRDHAGQTFRRADPVFWIFALILFFVDLFGISLPGRAGRPGTKIFQSTKIDAFR